MARMRLLESISFCQVVIRSSKSTAESHPDVAQGGGQVPLYFNLIQLVTPISKSTCPWHIVPGYRLHFHAVRRVETCSNGGNIERAGLDPLFGIQSCSGFLRLRILHAALTKYAGKMLFAPRARAIHRQPSTLDPFERTIGEQRKVTTVFNELAPHNKGSPSLCRCVGNSAKHQR